MILTKEQKQNLFKEGYVDSRVLDACIEPGWQDYFIDNFTWKLNVDRPDFGGWLTLTLSSKEGIEYVVELNPSVLNIL